jgi:predicted transcriptional regulator
VAGKSASRVAVLSIHPRFSRSILKGEKRVEFRKFPLAGDIEHVLIYETAPTSRLVGSFKVERVERAAPATLWRRHYRHAGLRRSEFLSYFSGRDVGYAIVVREVRRLRRRLELRSVGLSRPPQSFCYVDCSSFEGLARRHKVTNGIARSTAATMRASGRALRVATSVVLQVLS